MKLAHTLLLLSLYTQSKTTLTVTGSEVVGHTALSSFDLEFFGFYFDLRSANELIVVYDLPIG